MDGIINFGADRSATVYLAVTADQKDRRWLVSELPNDIDIVFESTFTKEEFLFYQSKLLASGSETDFHELENINALFALGNFVQLFLFEQSPGTNLTTPPISMKKKYVYRCSHCRCIKCCSKTNSLPLLQSAPEAIVFKNGAETKIIQVSKTNANKPVCNKIDYNLNFFYDRVWLSSSNLQYLNNLGLLHPARYDAACNTYCESVEGIGTCYTICNMDNLPSELRAAIKKIMTEAGWNPSDAKIRGICNTVAWLVYLKGSPLAYDQGCGVRLTYSSWFQPFNHYEMIGQY